MRFTQNALRSIFPSGFETAEKTADEMYLRVTIWKIQMEDCGHRAAIAYQMCSRFKACGSVKAWVSRCPLSQNTTEKVRCSAY